MALFPIPAKLRGVTLFTLAYLIVAGFFSLQSHNLEFLFYIGVVVVMAFVVLAVYEHVNLTMGLVWFMSIWGLMHMIGGIMPVPEGWPINGTKAVFYSLWIIPNLLKYDQVVHAYGFGMSTWVCWQALRTTLKDPEPKMGVLLLCMLAGMGLGAGNEVIEFIATLLIPNTNVGGYINTGWDLVANMVGSIIAVLVIWGIRPKRTFFEVVRDRFISHHTPKA
jgi:uncharacterized membrane protein YjdF